MNLLQLSLPYWVCTYICVSTRVSVYTEYYVRKSYFNFLTMTIRTYCPQKSARNSNLYIETVLSPEEETTLLHLSSAFGGIGLHGIILMLLLPHQAGSLNWLGFSAKSSVLFLSYFNWISPVPSVAITATQLSTAHFPNSVGGFAKWTSVGQVPTPGPGSWVWELSVSGGAAPWYGMQGQGTDHLRC